MSTVVSQWEKIIRNRNIEKKSNFISSDFVLLLVCLIYRSKVPKNVKMICVAICGGSSYNMTGLLGKKCLLNKI